MTIHTCNPGNPGQPLPFGRRGADCARCTELSSGAAPRTWSARRISLAKQATTDQRATAAAIVAHFAPDGPHARGACGPVCTAFDA